MPHSIRSLWRTRHAPALVVAAVGCIVYAAWQPPTTDLAVVQFRVELFRSGPFSVWNNQWFGGHHTTTYLLSPVLAFLIGVVGLGVVSVLAGAWFGSVLVHLLTDAHPTLHRPRLAAVALTFGLLTSLYGGRTTFLLGAAIGIATLCGALAGRFWLTSGLVVLTSVASPVAGVFVALIGCAVVCAHALRFRIGVVMVVGSLVPIGLLAVLFAEGGDFPFPAGGVVNALIATGLVAVLGWRFRAVRWAALGYAVFCVLCAAVANPVGGNAARFAALTAPVGVVMLAEMTFTWVAVLAAPLVLMQLAPISMAVAGDRAQTEASFYAPLLVTLSSHSAPLRVEVVPVATHGEANFVASRFPIARGWHRQLDRKYNGLFYRGQLDPREYESWLRDLGVGFVAIANTPLDVGGVAEARLLANPPQYLREIHRDTVWRVFEVTPAPSLVDGAATLLAIDNDSFTIRARSGGPVTVKVRFSPWFELTEGVGCVRRSPGGWTVVDAKAGIVRVAAQLSVGALWHRHGSC